MAKLRVMLVDDHAVLRAGLQLLVNGQPDMTVVAEAGAMQEAVQLAGQCEVDVIVMDLSLPDGDGMVATEQILRRHPQAQVVGLTRHEDLGYLKRMLGAGARGYVLKHSVPQGLLAAIRAVVAGETYIDSSFTTGDRAQLAGQGGVPAQEAVRAAEDTAGELTADEITVLQYVARSYTNSEMAGLLGMPETAVAEHKVRAMRKLGLRTRIDVLRYVETQGWKRAE